MSLFDHLTELRRRLFISVGAMIVGLIIGFFLYPHVFHIIESPYCRVPSVRRNPGHCALNAIGVLDPFKIRLRVSLLTGMVLAAPVWLYQLWAFITPGLHRHERRWSITFVGGSIALFLAGAYLAYRILPTSLGALLPFGGHDLNNLVTADSYLQYFQAMIIVFGCAFELPLVMLLLCAAGVVTGRRLLGWWRIMIFAITCFSAVAVPSPDPASMLLLMVPMIALFYVSCGACLLVDRRRRRRQAAEDRRLSEELGIAVEDLRVPFVDVELD